MAGLGDLFGSLGSDLLGAYGTYDAAKAGNTANSAYGHAITSAGDTYNMGIPGVTGPGGLSTSPFSPGSGGGLNINLGAAGNQAYSGFTNLANNSLNKINSGGVGLPAGVMQALQQLQYSTGQTPQGTQGFLSNVGNQGAGGLINAGTSTLNNPLIGQAFGNAGNLLNSANGAYSSAYNSALNSQLGVLQNQQDLALNSNNNLEFAQGRLGTSGGALQTKALAQGFGLADLQAQNNAVGLANNAMQTNFLGANTANNIGLGLLNSGGNLLSAGGSLGANIGNSIFNQNAAINQIGVNNANTNFTGQTSGSMLPGQLSLQQLQLALGGISGNTALSNIGNNSAALGLSAYNDIANNQNAATKNLWQSGFAMQGGGGSGTGQAAGQISNGNSGGGLLNDVGSLIGSIGSIFGF